MSFQVLYEVFMYFYFYFLRRGRHDGCLPSSLTSICLAIYKKGNFIQSFHSP